MRSVGFLNDCEDEGENHRGDNLRDVVVRNQGLADNRNDGIEEEDHQ